jgi:translation initiation factor 2 beta subunit (eIF-2beta)/eIF-5
MSLNIPQSMIDPFYRYRREKLRLEPRGKKTHLLNLPKIAQQLNRTPEELISLFKKSTGSTMYPKNNQIVINGNFTVDQLETILESYIEDHVVCSTCGNPETTSAGRCLACGSI